MIRGPPSPSWLLGESLCLLCCKASSHEDAYTGHQYILRHAKNVGDYEAAWYREYGSVVRIAGVLSVRIIHGFEPN